MLVDELLSGSGSVRASALSHFLEHAACTGRFPSSQNRTKHAGASCWCHTPRFLSHLVLNPPSAACLGSGESAGGTSPRAGDSHWATCRRHSTGEPRSRADSCAARGARPAVRGSLSASCARGNTSGEWRHGASAGEPGKTASRLRGPLLDFLHPPGRASGFPGKRIVLGALDG